MIGSYCIKNGALISPSEASIPIDDLAALYGFGVYESVRLIHGQARFLSLHIERLFHSASILSLTHPFSQKDIVDAITLLVEHTTEVKTANIKIILLGGSTPTYYAYCVAPKFVEKKEYREGIHTIVFEYERFLPQAKSLNMLPSYIGFTQAKQAGAFDALCVNRDGNITEGTRTNFFAVQGATIYTPKESEILLGITRTHVLACAKKHEWSIEETDIPLASLTKTYDGAFLTNTSSGIVPIRSVGDALFSTIPENIQLLRTQYKQYIQEVNQ